MGARNVVVDGISLGPESDFLELFRRQLRGYGVFQSKTAYGPEDGVVRVLGTAQGTAIEAGVKDALIRLALDKDPAIRAGAVMAIGTYPRIFGDQALIGLLDANIKLFRGVPPLAHGFPDLEWELLEAIAATGTTAKMLDRFKSAVMDPANGGRFIGLVTRADPGWVIQNAREATLGQAPRADGVFAGLPDAASRERYATALSAEPIEFRRQVTSRLKETVRDGAERERLRKILISSV